MWYFSRRRKNIFLRQLTVKITITNYKEVLTFFQKRSYCRCDRVRIRRPRTSLGQSKSENTCSSEKKTVTKSLHFLNSHVLLIGNEFLCISFGEGYPDNGLPIRGFFPLDFLWDEKLQKSELVRINRSLKTYDTAL